MKHDTFIRAWRWLCLSWLLFVIIPLGQEALPSWLRINLMWPWVRAAFWSSSIAGVAFRQVWTSTPFIKTLVLLGAFLSQWLILFLCGHNLLSKRTKATPILFAILVAVVLLSIMGLFAENKRIWKDYGRGSDSLTTSTTTS